MAIDGEAALQVHQVRGGSTEIPAFNRLAAISAFLASILTRRCSLVASER
jgi:hypothetical protein